MARLTGETHAKYLAALSDWRLGNGFKWTERASDWLYEHAVELGEGGGQALTLPDVGRLMYEFVANGGEVDQVGEQRENWRDEHAFHYDIVMPIGGQEVYIETRLMEESRVDDPYIFIVNMKYHKR